MTGSKEQGSRSPPRTFTEAAYAQSRRRAYPSRPGETNHPHTPARRHRRRRTGGRGRHRRDRSSRRIRPGPEPRRPLRLRRPPDRGLLGDRRRGTGGDREHARLQLLLPAAGLHAHARGPVELVRARRLRRHCDRRRHLARATGAAAPRPSSASARRRCSRTSPPSCSAEPARAGARPHRGANGVGPRRLLGPHRPRRPRHGRPRTRRRTTSPSTAARSARSTRPRRRSPRSRPGAGSCRRSPRSSPSRASARR